MAAPGITGIEMLVIAPCTYLGVEGHPDWSFGGDHMNPRQLCYRRLGQPAARLNLIKYWLVPTDSHHGRQVNNKKGLQGKEHLHGQAM